MNVKFFNPGKAYLEHRDELLAEYDRVRSAGDLILRKDVEVFEKNLSNFVGTKYAIALNSGTDALVLVLKQFKNIEIATPSYTFKSTIGAVLTSGNTPVLYDLNEKMPEYNVGIVAHIAGEIYPFPGTPIVVEDACQALGAIKNPQTYAQTWSFYPAKILGAPGDAGAITTNDENLADYAREARNHFKNDNRDFGMNSRMDNVWAAELNVWMKYLPDRIETRKKIATLYNEHLDTIPYIILPHNQPGRVWQDYIIRTFDRDELYEFLKKERIETMRNEYPFPSRYQKLPITAEYESQTLRLPCNPELEEEEVEYVITKIQEFYARR